MIKRFFTPAMALFGCLALGSCTPFAGVVSDHWPTWAGGMPNDVPPRPGAPGYDDFLIHQQGKDVTAPAPPADNAQAAPAVTAEKASVQAVPSGNAPRNAQGAAQGGLY